MEVTLGRVKKAIFKTRILRYHIVWRLVRRHWSTAVHSDAVTLTGRGCFKNCLTGPYFLHSRSSILGSIRSFLCFQGMGIQLRQSADSKAEREM